MRMFAFLKVPELSPASATSFSLFTIATPNWLNHNSQSELVLIYDWQITTNKFVLAPNRLKLTTRDFYFSTEPLRS
jgi:hypothetical protein